MRTIGKRILAGTLAVWLVALFGCGTAPTAPQLSTAGTPAAGEVRPGGASHDGLIGDLIEPITRPVTRLIGEDGLELLAPVSGDDGAMLKVGDVTVKVPPDAFSGDAEIKVTVPDSTKLECHLEIYPPSKNNFANPVRLEFDVKDGRDVRVMVVYWFDEDAQAWVPLTTSVDRNTGKIWAELPHFSIYKADSEVQGRAGW